jgi:uncharacterized protein (UPF0332 family)
MGCRSWRKFAARASIFDASEPAPAQAGAADHLAKAQHCLSRARIILDADVPEVAAREAYLAAFPAAQALIFERTGNEAKTHKGAHTQFARFTRHEPRVDTELRQFLARSYDMKSLSDYEIGPYAELSKEQAVATITTAARFVACVAELLK